MYHLLHVRLRDVPRIVRRTKYIKSKGEESFGELTKFIKFHNARSCIYEIFRDELAQIQERVPEVIGS
jgi:hypothetical protein